MTLPAATIGCYHICPASDGDHPHQGGPIIDGSITVYFENKMAGRQGDQLQCNSSNTDTIIKGSSSVFINGLPAARQGDPTAHGGQITGSVKTIFIE